MPLGTRRVDIIGASVVFVIGLQVAGMSLWVDLVVDFTLAFALGIVFQYMTIAPMRHLGRIDGLKAALRADTLSLVAFEIGLFAWMILLQLVIFAPRPLEPDEPAYWFMMQIGMVLGFLTAYPANWWLVRNDYKERMQEEVHHAGTSADRWTSKDVRGDLRPG